jgi:sulfate transport system permease protein
MGEFGSVVVVSGNIPLETLTAPVYVFGEIESGFPHAAAVVSSLLFISAIALQGLAAWSIRFLGRAT